MRRVRLPTVALAALALFTEGAGSGTGGARARAVPVPPQTCRPPDGDVPVPAGEVLLGEDGADKPGKRVKVPAFRIDRHEVTNRQFAAFVAATGYRTEAEIQGAGAVFVVPRRLDGLGDASQWWKLRKGAFWRSPTGPGSSIAGRMADPVVQVTYADAQAYARWAGRGLPDEAQWERAARGAQVRTAPPSSWAYDDQGHPTANTWQGPFPVADAGDDGHRGLAPAGCFKPNDFGLYDMIGNAWEWTSQAQAGQAQAGASSRIVKGGSFLCSFDYCANFRPAGWQAQEADLPTSHIGFRTVARSLRRGAG